MSNVLHAGITVRLSDDALVQALDMHRITGAWLALLEALKELPVEDTFSVGDAKPEPVRRRRGRPRLAVAEPPTAA